MSTKRITAVVLLAFCLGFALGLVRREDLDTVTATLAGFALAFGLLGLHAAVSLAISEKARRVAEDRLFDRNTEHLRLLSLASEGRLRVERVRTGYEIFEIVPAEGYRTVSAPGAALFVEERVRTPEERAALNIGNLLSGVPLPPAPRRWRLDAWDGSPASQVLNIVSGGFAAFVLLAAVIGGMAMVRDPLFVRCAVATAALGVAGQIARVRRVT